MCGIAGYVGHFPKALLHLMQETLDHRGPDGHGSVCIADENVGFAHTRLSIIDVSDTGAQPMWNADKNLCITYNGEIYNFQDLRKTLKTKGYNFTGGSDTEVLLAMYQEYGHDMLQQLNGIFAFAIWDEKANSVFIARDGLGVKPLYYAETVQGFLFASEIKALLHSKSVTRDIDLEAMFYYLTYLWAPAPYTPLQAVRKLLPGHAMLVDKNGVQKTWCFYDLPYDQPVNQNISESDAVDALREILETAVTRQMMSDVPLGAFLSGGLDSSAVAAFAQRYCDQNDAERLSCFTIQTDDADDKQEGRVSDLPYAKQVAEHLGVDLNVVPVQPDMWQDLDKMLWFMDEPQADLASLNVWYIAQHARERGIKVLLGGSGGDDIFTGYKRHYALQQGGWIQNMPMFLRKTGQMATGCLPRSNPKMRRIAKFFQYVDLPQQEWLVSFFYWLNPVLGRGLFADDVAFDAAAPLLKSLECLPEDCPDMHKMLYLEAKHFLCDHNLNYTDKMSMATGVEARVPLLDKDLVDFACRLPPHLKQKGRQGKYIFKKAMEGLLPHDVIYRPKAGFGVPLRQWLKGPLKSMVQDVLAPDVLRARGIFDADAVQKMIAQNDQGREDASYSILALVCMERWCQIFIDQTPKTL